MRKRINQQATELALSIGIDGIALAVLVKQDNLPPKIIHCELVKYSRAGDLRHALQQFVDAYGFRHMRCTWVLEPEQYQLKLIDAFSAKETELAQAARWRIKDQLAYPVSDAAVDTFAIPAYGTGRQHEKLYVVASRRSYLQKTLEVIHAVGLDLVAIDIYEFALRNLIRYLFAPEKTQLVMTLAKPYSQLLIFHQGHLYSVRHLYIDITAAGLLQKIVTELERSLHFCEHELLLSVPQEIILAPHFNEYDNLSQDIEKAVARTVLPMDLTPLLDSRMLLEQSLQIRCLGAMGGALQSPYSEEAAHAAD